MTQPGDERGAARPLHILEIVGNAIPGGMERTVEDLIRGLPADRYRVTCLVPHEGAFTAALRRVGCEVFVTPIRDDPAWRSIQLAVGLVRRGGVDLLHAHMARAHVLAGLAGRLTGRPVLATVHGMDVTAQELGIQRLCGSHLLVVCQEAYGQALALGVPPERLQLVRNGVDTAAYRPGGDGTRFRAALGVPPEAPLLGFIGRLAPEKGPDGFLRMAAEVHRARPDVHFALVGEGVLESALAALIEDLGLGGRAHLAGFWADAREVYPACDAVVQTSRGEGTPLAVLEAMACGRAVVAMAVGGVPELVAHGVTGLLVGPGDWQGTAAALLALLAQPTRLRRMGDAARERATTCFDLRATVRRTSDLFDRLGADRAAVGDERPGPHRERGRAGRRLTL